MTASILETGAAHLLQLLTANHYEKYRNNMTSVSSQVLGDKSFILPLSSQMVHTQACFPEINICMKAKKNNEFLLNEFQVKCYVFFLHSGTSAVCVYPEEYSLLKRYILKGVFLPLCSPVSCISLIYVRRCEIETTNRREWCILFIAFISIIRDGDWPKRGLWRLDSALAWDWFASLQHPRWSSWSCTARWWFWRSISALLLPLRDPASAFQSPKCLRHIPQSTHMEYPCV